MIFQISLEGAWSNECCALKQSKIFSFIYLLFAFPCRSAFHLLVPLLIFWQHTCRFIFLSASHSQTPPVKLCGCLKFHTLFNILLACLFLFMPTRFMRFLIISSSLPPITLCSSSLAFTSTLYLCHRHLAASLTSDDLFRERDKEKKETPQRYRNIAHSHWKVSLCHLIFHSTFCSCT